jgi:CheY-like chemotaxis protein
VDDNEDNLQLISELLLIMNCCFITAIDGESAIIMAQNLQAKINFIRHDVAGLSG